MASTSTNKQPLLVDNVFHEAVNVGNALNLGFDVLGSNSAALLVDCIGKDGAIVEDLYTVSRGAAYAINIFLSSANDYLRPSESVFIGGVGSTDVVSTKQHADLPETMTPVPRIGSNPKNAGLYVPRNKALWVALNSNIEVTDAPIVAAQGGFF